MSDIIRTVRRFGEYYTRAEPFRESDPRGWESREAAGQKFKAALKFNARPGPTVSHVAPLDAAHGEGREGTSNVLPIKRRKAR